MEKTCFLSDRGSLVSRSSPGQSVIAVSFKAVIGLAVGALIAASCATRQNVDDQFRETIILPVPRSYTILEYKNASGDMPQWLRYYLDADEEFVETLPDYADDYIFVINEKGIGLSALARWSDYFRIEQDFSHAVFLRMYNRLVAESEGRPDYYLGDFFENFLKKIAGHVFDGASRVDDYWIKVSFERDTGNIGATDGYPESNPETGEEYRYYILAKINKIAFQQEITKLFSAAHSEVTPDKLQESVLSRLQNTLFSGF
jgi:hypothetical protein